MRIGTIIPTNGGKVIGEGHVRIIWASWHIVTLFGWLIAATLILRLYAVSCGTRQCHLTPTAANG